MNTEKLDSFLQRSITYAFYSLFFFVPFLFYTGNSELFEFNKMVATYALTVVITGAWVGRSIVAGRFVFQKSVLDIPLLLFLLSQILSTFFSIDRHTSIWGYYSRSNGGLLSILCYLLLYWAYVSNTEKENVRQHVKALLGSSIIISLYAVLEHFGYSASCILIKGEFSTDCWVQDVRSRVFATLGQPNWLAAWLVAIAPLAWVIDNLKFRLGASSAIFSAILFTKSRSGLLAYAATFGVFWFYNLLKRQDIKSLLIHTSLLILLASFFGTPWTPRLQDMLPKTPSPSVSENQPSLPSSGTVLENGGTESFSIRQIVWKGAIDIWRAYPLFGSGVETFAYSYYEYRPLEHNQTSEWDFLYNKAHNEYLNYLATTGTLGFVSYLLFIVTFLVWSLKNIGKVLPYFSGFVGILITNYAGFSVVPTATLLFLLPAMALVTTSDADNKNWKRKEISFKGTEIKTRKIAYLIVLSLLAIYLLLNVFNIWSADLNYAEGDRLNRKGYPHLAATPLGNAIELRRDEPLYYNKYAVAASKIAATLFEENEATKAAEIAIDADNLQSKALSISPRNIQIVKEAYNNYVLLSAIDQKYLQRSHSLAQYLSELAPTDPKAWHMLGLSLTRIGQDEEAIKALERSKELRPTFADPRYVLASLYAKNGQKDKAKRELQYVLDYIDIRDAEAKTLLEELQLN